MTSGTRQDRRSLDANGYDAAEQRRRFREDGVVFVPQALSAPTMREAERAFAWSLANPGRGAARLPSKGDGVFYQDLQNPGALAAYAPLLAMREIADLVAALWGKPDVWFMYEQVFEKHGRARRTPWHQDTPYLPIDGDDVAVLWISFDVVDDAHALEFVRGSHRGTIYDGSRFDPVDDTAPIYGDGTYPRLPDIEANRERFDIVHFATEPGDVIVFHPSTLHGGGATDESISRRTLSLRFFGDDARVAERPGRAPAGVVADTTNWHPLARMRLAAPGSPFRDPGFPKIG